MMLLSSLLLFFLPVGLTQFAQADTEPRIAKIVTVEAFSSNFERKFFGRVTAKETVTLAFQVGGQIIDFSAVEGQRLSQGDVIARLDLEPFELALEQARLEQLQANRNLERLKRLRGSSVSDVAINDAETNAALAAIKVKNAQRSLRQATLIAPFSALVASRQKANFSTIAAGEPIARLHDMSELRIEINVPEIVFQTVGDDPDYELTAQFPGDSREFTVFPREFNAEVSSIGQTFQITLGMPVPPAGTILPGSSVTVTATTKNTNPRLLLPASAILTTSEGEAAVMIFEPINQSEGAVRQVPVSIIPSSRGRTEVHSGLTAGQEVVAVGGAFLREGEIVRRFESFQD